MIYLNEWAEFLEGGPRGDILVLDQGPVYSLARLDTLQLPVTREPAFQRWNEKVTALWRNTLDMIVWLDAADEILWSRINTREQAHATKGTDWERTANFIATYRRAFSRTVDRFASPHGPRVLRFDTGKHATADIVPILLTGLLSDEDARDE